MTKGWTPCDACTVRAEQLNAWAQILSEKAASHEIHLPLMLRYEMAEEIVHAMERESIVETEEAR